MCSNNCNDIQALNSTQNVSVYSKLHIKCGDVLVAGQGGQGKQVRPGEPDEDRVQSMCGYCTHV